MKKLITLVVLLSLLAIQLTSCAPAPTPTATVVPPVVPVAATAVPTVDPEAAKLAGAQADIAASLRKQ